MKVTDFGPRIAPFDYYAAEHFAGRSGLTMMECGVDAGAHAEAMLRHIHGLTKLFLVDPWERTNLFQKGICKGRLDAIGGHGRYLQIACTFQVYAASNPTFRFDGIYCDLPQDGQTAREAVTLLWPLLNPGGLFGYRNYSPSWPDMKRVLDEFTQTHHLAVTEQMAELIIFKP